MPNLEGLRKFPRNQAIIQKSDRLFNVFPTGFDLETIMTTGSKAVVQIARIAISLDIRAGIKAWALPASVLIILLGLC